MCLFPRQIKVHRGFGDNILVPAPCGICPECLSKQRKEWFIRNKIELENSINGFFVTLTYNEENLPRSKMNNQPCFCKEDIQKFFKRFRKNLNSVGIKYFLASEYGGQFGRPHYHALIYNIPYEKVVTLPDLLAKSWSKGFTSVAPINDRRISYVTKYMLQKCQRRKDFSDECFAPFYLSSRRPAIGASYLSDSNRAFHLSNRVNTINIAGKIFGLPTYYKRKIFEDYPDIKDEMRLSYLKELHKKHEKIIKNPELYKSYCESHFQHIKDEKRKYKKYAKQKFDSLTFPEHLK